MPIWVWAIPAVLVVLGALAFFLRRKRPAEEAEDWPEVQEVAEPVAPPVPKPAPVPQPEFASPQVSPRPAPTPPPAAAPEAVDIAFEPVGLRLSLVFATLQYRVTLTAGTDLPAGHLIGDMIGAHGSLTSEQQLAPPLETLTPLKPVPALAAGRALPSPAKCNCRSAPLGRCSARMRRSSCRCCVWAQSSPRPSRPYAASSRWASPEARAGAATARHRPDGAPRSRRARGGGGARLSGAAGRPPPRGRLG
ncbi:hypothetical protein ACFSLT_20270 [Novosphingobium resinovorum]